MSTKKLAILAACTVLALGLSYVESLIPFFGGVPGMKVGLPNLVIFFLLYKMSWKEAAVVSALRMLLTFFLFGNFISLLYSAAGGFISILLMAILSRKTKLSKATVSIVGAVSHNVGQILIAMLLLDAWQIVYYLPVLVVFAVFSGLAIGIISSILIKRIKI